VEGVHPGMGVVSGGRAEEEAKQWGKSKTGIMGERRSLRLFSAVVRKDGVWKKGLKDPKTVSSHSTPKEKRNHYCTDLKESLTSCFRLTLRWGRNVGDSLEGTLREGEHESKGAGTREQRCLQIGRTVKTLSRSRGGRRR